ncbi:MAG: hypothetical protein AB1505_07510 [Candidatus Latescibacterota bacterium]
MCEDSRRDAGRPKVRFAATAPPLAYGHRSAPASPSDPVKLCIDADWVCQELIVGGHTFAHICAAPSLPADVAWWFERERPVLLLSRDTWRAGCDRYQSWLAAEAGCAGFLFGVDLSEDPQLGPLPVLVMNSGAIAS